MNIDLDDKITPNFKWREMLFCPQWNVHVFPLSNMHKENIIDVCETLETIRDILKSPLKITSGYRPRLYNSTMKPRPGSTNSYHIQGLAADFIPTKVSVHKARLALKDFLPDLQCRMENIKGGWIHIDLGAPRSGGRFFKP